MRLPLLPLAVLAAALLSPLSLQAPLAAAPSANAQARVIVTFKADAPMLRRQALAFADRAEDATRLSAERAGVLGGRLGLGLRGGRHVTDRTQVILARGISSAQLVRRLAADNDVESVVIDRRRYRLSVPNDPLYADGQSANPGPAVGQWYLRAPTSTVRSAINAEAAWAVTTGRPSVVVAVLDTGVRFDHADLAGNLLPGYDMIHDEDGAAVAGDFNGRDGDASDPGDYVSAADKAAHPTTFDDCSVEDSSWHGTETASLIGALTGNGIGMASVGRNVRVLPIRVLGKCAGYDSDIQAAMYWAAGIHVPGVPDNKTKAAIINLSLGGVGVCDADSGYPTVVSRVISAGTAIIAAAGNGSPNDGGHKVVVPANCPGVIAVGGLRHAGSKVGYSDLGREVAISAPAGNCINIDNDEPCLYPIITARNSGVTTPVAGLAGSVYSDGQRRPSTGTSFSAPLVAGTAALMLSVQPALTPADLRRLLQASARPFPTTGDTASVPMCREPSDVGQKECYCTKTTCGAGMLDAGAAVQAALSDAALGVDARIAVSPVTPSARQAVQFSAAGSVLAPGRTIASVAWVITDGGGIVEGFSSAANGVVVTVIPTAAGRFSVSATVTDNLGSSDVASSTVVVASGDPGDPPVVDPGPGAGGGGGGGGGGGALGWPWLLGLAASVVAVARGQRRRAG